MSMVRARAEPSKEPAVIMVDEQHVPDVLAALPKAGIQAGSEVPIIPLATRVTNSASAAIHYPGAVDYFRA
jgi:hypothetical protein